MPLNRDTITEVIRFCNRDLVPDHQFGSTNQFHNEWFKDYFSFLGAPNVEVQLGDAFYQARFMYKLMNALNLPFNKHKGIVKFQIIQYASICEAVLDTAIRHFFGNDAETFFSVSEYVKFSNAVSVDTKITCGGTQLFLCKIKKKNGDLKRTRIDNRTEYAVSKGLISQATKDSFDSLYDLRNNIHIIKAANSQYVPKLRESKEAFILMQTFVGEIKNYYNTHTNTTI